jgi:ADP-ribose pyrophosphatase YjhB (NUDIX family)
MLQRNAARGAFAGFWVFPGGRVDDTDADDVACAVRESVEETGLVIDPALLVRWSHWTPPITEPKRFGTWFFVAPVALDAVVCIDEAEIVGHAWLSVAEILTKREAGEIGLAPPTFITVTSLAEFATVADVVAHAATTEPDIYATTLVKQEGVLAVMWPPDAALSEGATLETPGDRHRLVMNTAPWVYERSGEWAAV